MWSVVLVAVVAAALRVSAVSSGVPFLWNPDEPTNLRVGAVMVDHVSWNPHYFSYPSMLYDVIAMVGWVQRVVGGWHKGAGLAYYTYQHLTYHTYQNQGINRTMDPHLLIVLRSVTVLLSIGTCVVVWGLCYFVTRRWWVATLAGLLLAVSPLMVANSVVVTPDMYSAFFTALGLLAAIWLHEKRQGAQLHPRRGSSWARNRIEVQRRLGRRRRDRRPLPSLSKGRGLPPSRLTVQGHAACP